MSHRRIWIVLAAFAVFAAGVLQAQLQTGNIYGSVVNSKGAPLSDTTVTLTGKSGTPQVQVTNADGQFTYLNLAAGSYNLTAQLEGYSPSAQSASVSVGKNTTVKFTLAPAVPARKRKTKD
jgi:hypothetical protein